MKQYFSLSLSLNLYWKLRQGAVPCFGTFSRRKADVCETQFIFAQFSFFFFLFYFHGKLVFQKQK